MIVNLYAVRDEVAQNFSSLFEAENHEDAKRLFKDWISDPKNRLHAHPENYLLVFVCAYDHDSGCIYVATRDVVHSLDDLVDAKVVFPEKISSRFERPDLGMAMLPFDRTIARGSDYAKEAKKGSELEIRETLDVLGREVLNLRNELARLQREKEVSK